MLGLPTTRHSQSSQLYSKFGVSPSPLAQGRPSRHKLPPEFLAYYGWHTRLDRYDSRLRFPYCFRITPDPIYLTVVTP